MERKEQFIGWVDIFHGVGELVVDEAKIAFHAVTDRHRNPVPSEHHVVEVVPPEVEELPEGGRWTEMGTY